MSETIQHPDRSEPYIELGWYDRIVFDGKTYNAFSSDSDGVILRRADGLVEYRWFSQTDLGFQIAKGLMVIETNFFLPRRKIRSPSTSGRTKSRR